MGEQLFLDELFAPRLILYERRMKFVVFDAAIGVVAGTLKNASCEDPFGYRCDAGGRCRSVEPSGWGTRRLSSEAR
jgi:hypothetical protein